MNAPVQSAGGITDAEAAGLYTRHAVLARETLRNSGANLALAVARQHRSRRTDGRSSSPLEADQVRAAVPIAEALIQALWDQDINTEGESEEDLELLGAVGALALLAARQRPAKP